jgi:hypothetical protein
MLNYFNNITYIKNKLLCDIYMTPIKHIFNTVLDMKSDKHNLKQGDDFIKNKMKFLLKPKIIEGIENNNNCTINDRKDIKLVNFVIPENDSDVLEGARCYMDNNKKPEVACDNTTGLFTFKGCDPYSIEDKITVEERKRVMLSEKIKATNKIDIKNKGRNVKVGKDIYFVNQNNNYYKYINSIGDSTFKPKHVNFNATCPTTSPNTEDRLYGFLEGTIDPVNGDACLQYELDSEEQMLYAQFLESERKLRDLKAEQMEQQSDTSGIRFEKNKATIKLSKQLQDYDKLVKKSKYYSDKINSLNLSHDEFLKGITMLQLQYGVFGVSSIILIYFISKMLISKK